MKLNLPKLTILFILTGGIVIIGLSALWYGTDPWFFVVVGIFAAGMIAIGIDRWILKRRNKK